MVGKISKRAPKDIKSSKMKNVILYAEDYSGLRYIMMKPITVRPDLLDMIKKALKRRFSLDIENELE